MTATSRASGDGELARVMDAARAPEWSLGWGRHGQIMATRDIGQIGRPWVVQATRSGRGLRVELYGPGDDTEVEGDFLATLTGNPRDMGRQLRTILSDLNVSEPPRGS